MLDIFCGSKLILIRSQSKMAFLRRVVLAQALLLTIEHAVAKPIPLITRQTIEEEYDFVICGGSCRTRSLNWLPCPPASSVLTFGLYNRRNSWARPREPTD